MRALIGHPPPASGVDFEIPDYALRRNIDRLRAVAEWQKWVMSDVEPSSAVEAKRSWPRNKTT